MLYKTRLLLNRGKENVNYKGRTQKQNPEPLF